MRLTLCIHVMREEMREETSLRSKKYLLDTLIAYLLITLNSSCLNRIDDRFHEELKKMYILLPEKYLILT